MKGFLKKIVKKFPYLKKIIAERDYYKSKLEGYGGWVEPGHYYSPISNLEEVYANEDRIFNNSMRELPGVNLNEEKCLGMFEEFKKFYDEIPFEFDPKKGLRYCYNNDYFSYGDAIALYSMIRYLKPKKVVEIGSGFSSCVTLDTNELFFDNAIECTFIEPYPERFLSLTKEGDLERVELIDKKLQDVDLEKILKLDAGDILFIDSSHVSKIGSDVNFIFFEILPRLKEGVYVHFHDIFYPFEYPKVWIEEGRSWQESYLLRAFLQYNNAFEVVFFNSFLYRFHHDKFEKEMPDCLKNPGGHCWIRRSIKN